MIEFDTLNFNDKKFEEVKKGVEVVIKDFCQIIEEYNSSLIGHKQCIFQFDELSIESIFGQLHDYEVIFCNSNVLLYPKINHNFIEY